MPEKCPVREGTLFWVLYWAATAVENDPGQIIQYYRALRESLSGLLRVRSPRSSPQPERKAGDDPTGAPERHDGGAPHRLDLAFDWGRMR
jgi:hypothetical protein